MHRTYMRRALDLAAKGLGDTAPNPAVGAVVVKAGRIIGEGYHHAAGQPHAEVLALRDAAEQARAADIYVTLEPCCHFGRTPPCTEAIKAAGIARVFYACADPDPRVAGGGHAALQSAGIEVARGPLEHAATDLNRAYFKHKTTGLPYVTLKMAMTMDGRVAMADGTSQWITGPEAREVVHQMRSQSQLVMVGSGTVSADNPSLTARTNDSRCCDALVIDSSAGTPANAKALTRNDGTVCTVACCEDAPDRATKRLEQNGARILRLPAHNGHVDLTALMCRLGNENVMSILCEGGPTLAGALIARQLIDEMVFFIAPKIIGEGPGPVHQADVTGLAEAWQIEILETRTVGVDLMIRGKVCSRG